MKTDMCGTQGQSARCPREEPAQRLFRVNSGRGSQNMGIVATRTTEIHAALASRGNALLEWPPFRAWIGSRLKPSGKCRLTLAFVDPTTSSFKTVLTQSSCR